MGQPTLEVGGGGWVRWVDAELDIDVKVRFEFDPDDGRACPVQVVATAVDTTDPASGRVAETLRRLPWGRIEATANSPMSWTMLRARVDDDADVEIPGGWKVVRRGSPPQAVQGEAVASDSSATVWDAPSTSRVDPRLEVPNGGRYPDSFYMTFAHAYSALAAEGASPAAVLSEANGVARTTVHRWAKEARRRGFLAPGRRGKTG